MSHFLLYWPISLVWMQSKTKEALPAGSTVITAIQLRTITYFHLITLLKCPHQNPEKSGHNNHVLGLQGDWGSEASSCIRKWGKKRKDRVSLFIYKHSTLLSEICAYIWHFQIVFSLEASMGNQVRHLVLRLKTLTSGLAYINQTKDSPQPAWNKIFLVSTLFHTISE